MRILYFAPHPVCPLTTGARLRDYHCARQLARRAEVTFVEMCSAGESESVVPSDAGFVRVCTLTRDRSYTVGKILGGLLGPVPVTVLNYSSRRMEGELGRLMATHGPFDSVQLEGVHLSQFIAAMRACSGGAALVADWHNIESELMWRYSSAERNPAKRIVAKRTARLLEGCERDLIAGCDGHTTASERERDILRQRFPDASLHVIPNGVETAYYEGDGVEQRSRQRSLLFVGSMDYHANIDAVRWFAAETWPLIVKEIRDCVFTVVGRSPGPAIRALANGGIRVTGTVDDVRPYYKDAFAVVVPLRIGSGTRLKILEAMAAGVPVIASRLGAEGIDAIHERHILIADTPEETAAAVRRLRAHPEAGARLAEEAHRLVRNNYDWSVVGARLYDVHCGLMERMRKDGV
ncbi:MAG: glycosyltransferase [Bryobacterales bacterium]|nr:glycosyltransferase [Bryobacterales bacterium]